MADESLLSALLGKAEDIYFDAERSKLQWRWEKEQLALTLHRARASRFAFLKSVNAQPLDVEDYEAWLARYVASGNELQRYSEGSYPRPMQEQRGVAIFMQQVQQEMGIEVGTLERDYYDSDVIWHIEEPLTFEELPANLALGAELTLHLGQGALTSFDSERLDELGQESFLHLYLDGMWQAGKWLNQPKAWNAPAKVWEENLTNLRAKCERKEQHG